MMHGAIPPAFIGIEAWPTVPVQIHYARADPWVAEDDVRGLSEAVRRSGSRCEVYAYAEGGHLFADRELPDYSRSSAETMLFRVRQFLDRVSD